MHLVMGVPLRVATATSNLMIGITAAASAVIYLLRGEIDPYVAGPTAIGVFLGATIGSRIAHRIDVRILRWLFVVVLLYTAVQMLLKAIIVMVHRASARGAEARVRADDRPAAHRGHVCRGRPAGHRVSACMVAHGISPLERRPALRPRSRSSAAIVALAAGRLPVARAARGHRGAGQPRHRGGDRLRTGRGPVDGRDRARDPRRHRGGRRDGDHPVATPDASAGALARCAVYSADPVAARARVAPASAGAEPHDDRDQGRRRQPRRPHHAPTPGALDDLICYFEGHFVPMRDAKVSIMTHAFMYGTATFEGIRAYWNEERASSTA